MAVKISRRLVAEKVVDLIEQSGTRQAALMLAGYLVENKLARQAELYLRDIRRVLAERKSQISVEVASAHQLTAELRDDIIKFIKNQTAAKEVEIIDTVDETLISGVVISTTDSIYDGSLKNKIKKLKAV
jgi:F-type H+-transporting ATPase subunit delta